MDQKHRIDETGKRYGSLRVIRFVHRTLADRFKRSKAKWLCVCDCGIRTEVFGDKLRSGHISRCLRCEREMRTKPMDNLVRRLRKEQQWGNSLDGEAADRIEALEKALRQIASADAFGSGADVANLVKIVRAALEGKDEG
jgi:hypothetical protein